MEQNDVLEIYAAHERRLRYVSSAFHRYLYHAINWDNRLISIKGPRGSGKTTLMLQRIKETHAKSNSALYLSLDNLWFAVNSLRELVDYHVAHGGTHVFIDEVHYLQNWQTVIKNLYDDYPGLNIVYTGSSMLKIDYSAADLSRRQVVYSLNGLSFREYLAFDGKSEFVPVALEQILQDHVQIAREITGRIKVLPAFDNYLSRGYYPFCKERGDGYEMRIKQIVNQVLESDFSAVEDVTPATVRKIKRMLMILAGTPPQTPNISALCRELECDRKMGLKMLDALARGGLLKLLESSSATLKNLSRPAKIYCDNPNEMASLVPNADSGTLRECFFLNQLCVQHNATYPHKGDFLVDGRYLFEVGGRKKSFAQIKDIPESYLAVDGIETGIGNRIPLGPSGFCRRNDGGTAVYSKIVENLWKGTILTLPSEVWNSSSSSSVTIHPVLHFNARIAARTPPNSRSSDSESSETVACTGFRMRFPDMGMKSHSHLESSK